MTALIPAVRPLTVNGWGVDYPIGGIAEKVRLVADSSITGTGSGTARTTYREQRLDALLNRQRSR